MWGVTCHLESETLEHVMFTLRVSLEEEHIVQRLLRESRCGTVRRIDDETVRFDADVYDTSEMIPWIRTFICRIASLEFTNKVAENQFLDDLDTMYEQYGIGGEEA